MNIISRESALCMLSLSQTDTQDLLSPSHPKICRLWWRAAS